MARWAKIHTSGSSLEVTSITASGVDNNPSTTGHAMFISPDGIFQSTSSIQRRSVAVSDPFFNFTQLGTVLDVNYSTYSISVPDLPISVSFVTNSIKSDPLAEIISSSMLFTDPTGGLATSSSFFIEPILSFEGSQSGTNNSQLKSGSSFEGPNPVATGSFSIPLVDSNDPGTGQTRAITFHSDKTLGISYTSSKPNYVIWGDGDYLSLRRSLPVGMGITASFSIPVIYNAGNFGDADNLKFLIQLVRWDEYDEGGSYPAAVSETNRYVITATLRELFEKPNGSFPSIPASASMTGSFHLDSLPDDPIVQGEKWQLRGASRVSDQMRIGYGNLESSSVDQEDMKFELHGQTDGVLNATIIVGGVTSGSFEGSQFGNYSGSISGVTLNSTPFSKAIIKGTGLSFKKDTLNATVYNGTNLLTASLILYDQRIGLTGDNKSGLDFSNGSSGTPTPFDENPVLLTGSLPGDGLDWLNENYKFQVQKGSNSGLDIGTDTVKIASSFYGDGLEFTNNKISASLFEAGYGLSIEDNKLTLTRSLAGDGLTYNNAFNQRTLLVDSSYVVQRTQQLRISSSSPSLFYFSNGVNFNTSMSYTGSSLSAFYSLPSHTTLTSITGGLLIDDQDLIVRTGSGHSVELSTLFTTQQFLDINSGSISVTPFNRGIGGLIVQTSNNSGSSVIYDRGQGGAAWSEDSNRPLNEVGWMFSTSSTVGSTDQFPPYGDGNALSPVDKDYIALAQTVKTNDIENPNEGQSNSPITSRAGTVSATPVSPTTWADTSKLIGNSSVVGFALASNPNAGSSQADVQVTLSNYTFNIPNGSIIKGIEIKTGVAVETDGDEIVSFRVNIKKGTDSSFTTVTDHGNITSLITYTLTDGGPSNLVGLSGLTPSNIDDIEVQYMFNLPASQGLKLRGFYNGSAQSLPGVIVYYNTPDDQNNLFYATSSISNYGAIYVNTGSVSNDDSPVWMYSTD